MRTYKLGRSSLVLVSAMCGSLWMVDVGAGSDTGNMTVSASVTANCIVSDTGTPMSFSSYDPLVANASGGSDLHTTTTFSVQCTNGTAATLSMGEGNNAVSGQRNLLGGTNGDLLEYNLYSDTGYTTAWGDTIGVDTVEYNPSSSEATTLTVYGSAPKGQDVRVDTYSDTVTITANY